MNIENAVVSCLDLSIIYETNLLWTICLVHINRNKKLFKIEKGLI